jgi:hypothetical protein
MSLYKFCQYLYDKLDRYCGYTRLDNHQILTMDQTPTNDRDFVNLFRQYPAE